MPAVNGTWTTAVGFRSRSEAVRADHLLAEVRYPAEPPIPPGVGPKPVAGGVEPVVGCGDSAEAAWSDPSLAAESLLFPLEGPEPSAAALSHAADESVALTAPGFVAHRAAVAPWMSTAAGRASLPSWYPIRRSPAPNSSGPIRRQFPPVPITTFWWWTHRPAERDK